MEDLALDRSRNISFIVIGEKAKYLSAYTSIFIFVLREWESSLLIVSMFYLNVKGKEKVWNRAIFGMGE